MPRKEPKDNIAGQILRRARRKKGLSMTAVAVLAGISQPYLSELETGKKPLTSSVLEKLCPVLELTPFQLLGLMGIDGSVYAIPPKLPYRVERADLEALLEAFDAKGSMTTRALLRILAERPTEQKR